MLNEKNDNYQRAFDSPLSLRVETDSSYLVGSFRSESSLGGQKGSEIVLSAPLDRLESVPSSSTTRRDREPHSARTDIPVVSTLSYFTNNPSTPILGNFLPSFTPYSVSPTMSDRQTTFTNDTMLFQGNAAERAPSIAAEAVSDNQATYRPSLLISAGVAPKQIVSTQTASECADTLHTNEQMHASHAVQSEKTPPVAESSDRTQQISAQSDHKLTFKGSARSPSSRAAATGLVAALVPAPVNSLPRQNSYVASTRERDKQPAAAGRHRAHTITGGVESGYTSAPSDYRLLMPKKRKNDVGVARDTNSLLKRHESSLYLSPGTPKPIDGVTSTVVVPYGGRRAQREGALSLTTSLRGAGLYYSTVTLNDAEFRHMRHLRKQQRVKAQERAELHKQLREIQTAMLHVTDKLISIGKTFAGADTARALTGAAPGNSTISRDHPGTGKGGQHKDPNFALKKIILEESRMLQLQMQELEYIKTICGGYSSKEMLSPGEVNTPGFAVEIPSGGDVNQDVSTEIQKVKSPENTELQYSDSSVRDADFYYNSTSSDSDIASSASSFAHPISDSMPTIIPPLEDKQDYTKITISGQDGEATEQDSYSWNTQSGALRGISPYTAQTHSTSPDTPVGRRDIFHGNAISNRSLDVSQGIIPLESGKELDNLFPESNSYYDTYRNNGESMPSHTRLHTPVNNREISAPRSEIFSQTAAYQATALAPTHVQRKLIIADKNSCSPLTAATIERGKGKRVTIVFSDNRRNKYHFVLSDSSVTHPVADDADNTVDSTDFLVNLLLNGTNKEVERQLEIEIKTAAENTSPQVNKSFAALSGTLPPKQGSRDGQGSPSSAAASGLQRASSFTTGVSEQGVQEFMRLFHQKNRIPGGASGAGGGDPGNSALTEAASSAQMRSSLPQSGTCGSFQQGRVENCSFVSPSVDGYQGTDSAATLRADIATRITILQLRLVLSSVGKVQRTGAGVIMPRTESAPAVKRVDVGVSTDDATWPLMFRPTVTATAGKFGGVMGLSSNGAPSALLEPQPPTLSDEEEEEEGEGDTEGEQQPRGRLLVSDQTDSVLSIVFRLTRFAIPAAVSMGFNFLIFLVPLSCIGKVWGEAYFAGSSSAYFLSCIVGQYPTFGLLFALDTLISHEYGHNKFSPRIGLIVQRGILVVFAFVLLLYLPFCLFAARPLLRLMYGNEIGDIAASFLRFSPLFLLIYGVFTAFQKSMLNQMHPTYPFVAMVVGVAITSFIHILLIPHGVEFAMIGISIVWFAQLVIIVILMLRNSQVRRSFGSINIREALDLCEMKQFFAIALPAAVFVVGESASFDTSVLMATKISTSAGAAWSAIVNIFLVCVSDCGGISNAGCANVGAQIGMGRATNARKVAAVSVGCAVFLSVFNVIIAMSFFDPLMRVFGGERDALREANSVKWLLPMYHICDCIQFTFQGLFTGAGKARTGACILLSALWLVGVPLCAVLGFATKLKIFGVPLGLSVGMLIEIPLMVYFMFFRWDWDQLVLEEVDDEDSEVDSDDNQSEDEGEDRSLGDQREMDTIIEGTDAGTKQLTIPPPPGVGLITKNSSFSPGKGILALPSTLQLQTATAVVEQIGKSTAPQPGSMQTPLKGIPLDTLAPKKEAA